MKKGIVLGFAVMCMALGAGLLVGCEPKHEVAEVWSYNVGYHWHECGDCEDVFDFGAHTGGTNTCTQKALCEVCNQSYGEFASHAPQPVTEKAPTIEEVGHTAYQKCANCPYKEGYKTIPYLAFLQDADFSKEYDGSVVAEAEILSKLSVSTGYQANIFFFTKDMEETTPKDAGEYIVKVEILGDESTQAVTIQKEFEISPKQIQLVQTFEYNGGTTFAKTLSAVDGLVDDEVLELSVAFDSKNVGAEATTISITGEGKDNYSFTPNLSITPKPVVGTFAYKSQWIDKDGERSFYTKLKAENGLIEGDTATAYVVMESHEADASMSRCYVDGADGKNYSVQLSQFDVKILFKISIKNSAGTTLNTYVAYGDNKVYTNLLCTTTLSSIASLATTGNVVSAHTAHETGVSNNIILSSNPGELLANVIYNSNGDKMTDANGNWLITNGKDATLLTFLVSELIIQ